ncbi:MAG: NADP-dependent malic enzyme [Alphaproteobacteria bacterium]|jgi:malate dehydrogenase (oxaloacetate-decarboxylating)(NADP+)|nr:NADP-dependent malic enzyme [Alphaproteobacteria bacterium]
MAKDKFTFTDEEALRFHYEGRPGKLEIVPTKPLNTQRDLALAYSPGVAVPCLAIEDRPDSAYDYTNKGNLVAVISNGTAVLGLGNLGALASKPVMEGKAVLFKRFADVDSIDLEVDTEDIEEFIAAVRHLGPSFGGINLEDIKAPECFVIEQQLREMMPIPVFHDDQHGTAIITAAGLLNALDLTGRDIKDTKIVMNGAGSAGIACLELIKAMGLPHNNAVLLDSKGVIYQGREDGMNQWKSAHAIDTKDRTLEDVMKGADVFIGLSQKGLVSRDMVKSMNDAPIIFAMANPDPEITPEDVHAARDDAIVATGRSDYPNQVNNVLGFPYIFRGALDVRASTINDEMKVAAANALAALAREDVPDEVAAAYSGERPQYGPGYIIPVPFDPRLISRVSPAVAQAAMESGVAQRPIIDMDNYRAELRARLDPVAGPLHLILEQVRTNPKRVAFAEGEEEQIIRASIAYRDAGYGVPVLIGRPERVRKVADDIGLGSLDGIEIEDSGNSPRSAGYTDFLYQRLQRHGLLYRDCRRMVKVFRTVYAACMAAHGDVDACVTGLTRNSAEILADIRRVLDPLPGHRPLGITLMVARDRTVFIADTLVHEIPDSAKLADIAIQSAAAVRRLGHQPRVAMLSASTFGNPKQEVSDRVRGAVALLDAREVDFEYDGEMAADVALNAKLMEMYPFCRLSGPANVLIMPGMNAANISSKLLQEIGGGTVIGPLLVGLEKPAQILPMGSNVSAVVNLAALAAHSASAVESNAPIPLRRA